MTETGLPEEEIDRSLLWKRARMDKSGKYDPKAEGIVKKLVSSQTKTVLIIIKFLYHFFTIRSFDPFFD